MSERRLFSPEELARLREAAARGDALLCPRCAVILLPHRVPGRPPVSYVRRRTWYLCPSCRRSAVLDR